MPPLPQDVARVIGQWPEPARARARTLRERIHAVAAAEAAGPLTETLKWGQPAWLTEATGAGTTLRLWWTERRPDMLQILFHCQSRLADRLRDRFGSEIEIAGDRAALVPLAPPGPGGWALDGVIAAILTYHRNKAEHGVG